MSCCLPLELKRSTRFPIVDLAVSGALEGSKDLMEHALMYNVECKYIAKILAWWLPSEQKKIIEEVKVLLSQMYILAHQDLCQHKYCFTIDERIKEIIL